MQMQVDVDYCCNLLHVVSPFSRTRSEASIKEALDR
jgi:hypothetical protein